MRSELRNALERVGWDVLYEAHIPGLGPANARGERRALSPFPDVSDRSPSFSVNVTNGLWRCWNSNRAGNYVNFRAIMDAQEFDENGIAVTDYGATERALLIETGVANPVDPLWIARCRDTLYNDPALHLQLFERKPWDRNLLYSMNIGFNERNQRITIPIYDRFGSLVNVREYLPGGDPKFIWTVPGLTANCLTPWSAANEPSLILVEGETDMLTLRSYGFAAVSGNGGSNDPVPSGFWWWDKVVFVLMDADEPGRHAEAAAVRIMRERAREIRVITLPDWEGKPGNADITDWVNYLRRLGLGFQQIQESLSSLIEQASFVENLDSPYDSESVERTFSDVLTSENLGQRVRFVSRVTAKSSSRYVLPTTYNLVCPAQGHAFCRRCPMSTTFRGNGRFNHDPRSPLTLKLVQTSDDQQLLNLKIANAIPKQCPEPVMAIARAVDVEAVILSASVSHGTVDNETLDRARREAYVIVPPGRTLDENRDYTFEGFVYPHPKSQHAVFLIDTFEEYASQYDSFSIGNADVSQLEMFRPGRQQHPLEKMVEVARDISESTTLIFGRDDLHMAYRTVWHSALKFNLGGAPVDRGWIECLIVGDTRCGKTIAFRRMAELYGIGVLIDCKAMSLAGIMGTVVQSSSGDYYVAAGVLPQQDGRVVCFDEFHVPRYSNNVSLIESLSSTRSEGVVRISKAASAEFRARVRTIWLANPGMGKMLADMADSGAEVITRLISQPEDIARFDFALAVSQDTVSVDVVNQNRAPRDPYYSVQASRDLLAWTYSRRPNEIVFMDQATNLVIQRAKDMTLKYDPSIPIVEIADQRNRIAKVAVSVASQMFSSDPEHQFIIVQPEHVEAAHWLLERFYTDRVMDYDGYSERVIANRDITNEDYVLGVFESVLAPYGKRIAEELLRLDVFSHTMLQSMASTSAFTNNTIGNLLSNRCLHVTARGHKDAFEKTAAFTSWLKRYVSGQFDTV